ncbi:MAG: DUF2202 domain-containing protein [Chloroflexota bacterium]
MLKKILATGALVALIAVLVWGAVTRTQAHSNEEEAALGGGHGRNQENVSLEHTDEAFAQGQGNGRGGGRGQGAGGGGADHDLAGELANLPPATPGDLSDAEAQALAYMREEEKLAHDVYVTLYDLWGLPTFQNISQSEQTHTDSVAALLERYGLPDPASDEVGVFSDPNLQALYNDLVERGSQSLAEAIKVGAAIEEMDILDLQERLAETDNADIQYVFDNLMHGSYNHLQAFVSALSQQTGETYQPQYLTPEAYQAILAESGQGGNGRGGGGWRGGKP